MVTCTNFVDSAHRLRANAARAIGSGSGDEVGIVDMVDAQGEWTPLLYCCLWDWAAALELLIAAGAAVDAVAVGAAVAADSPGAFCA